MGVPAFAICAREAKARIILKAMIRNEEYDGPLRMSRCIPSPIEGRRPEPVLNLINE
jgi:hypothetical protein